MIIRSPESGRRLKFLGPVLLAAVGGGFLIGPSTLATATAEPESQPAKKTDPPKTNPAQPVKAAAAQPAATTAKARELVNGGKYKEGLEVVDQLLKIDPQNKYAAVIRPLLVDILAQERRDKLRRKNGGAESPLQGQKPAAEQPDDPDEKALLAQLERKLPEVRFDGVAFADVIDFLRDVSGVNLFVNWKALEAAGIDRKTPVNARLYNVRFAKALEVILDSVSTPKARVKFVADGGVISVATEDDFERNVLTRFYDIRDLITVAPDYELPAAQRAEPTTRPATSRPFDPAVEREQLLNGVIRLLRDTVAPESWREAGGKVGTMRELSGQLVITQTPENHLSAMQLLEQLRETTAIQIAVETRFFTCDETVMSNLISEWRKAGVGKTPSIVIEGGRVVKTQTGVYLDDAQVEQVLRAVRADRSTTMVSAPRMTLFNGRRGFVKVSQSRNYVYDYTTIRAADGTVRYDPVIGTTDSGLTLDVTALVTADRKYVALTLCPRITALNKLNELPWSGRPAGSNLTIQVADSTTTEGNTTMFTSDGGTILLGGMLDPDNILTAGAAGPQTRPVGTTQPAGDGKTRSVFILAKPQIIQQSKEDLPLSHPHLHEK